MGMSACKLIEVGEPESMLPEERLLWAILEISIRDINEAPKQTRENQYRRFRDRRAAIQFLTASHESPPPPFSFQWICGELSDGDGAWFAAKVRQMAGLTA